MTFLSAVVFRLRPLSYPDTDMFILLCALNQKDSLLNIRLVRPSELITGGNISAILTLDRFKWIGEVKHYSPRSQKVLAVTRCDLTDSSNGDEITDEMINIARKDLKLEAAYKVSAKTGENVDEMFEDIARRVKVKPVKRVNFCNPL